MLIGAVSVALVLTSVAVAGSTGVAGRGSGARGMSPRSRGGVKAGTGGSPRGSSQVRLAQLVHLRDRMAVVEAARRRWLASAPVRAARVASWTQFHGLSSSAAQALTASDFRGAFGAMGRSPATSVAEAGRVMRYLGDFRAIVVDRHGRQLLATSTVPLRTSAGPVDLRLIANRRGFSPARSAETLSIGHELDAGVSIGSGVRLVLEGADSSGRFSAQNSVFYPDVARDTDAAAAPTASGVDLSTVLRSRFSPQVLRYRLSVPRGSRVRVVSGNVFVSRGSRPVLAIRAPSAVDAQGTPVPVSMRFSHGQLVLTVRHRRMDIAYPVLVDPQVDVSADSPGWSWVDNFIDNGQQCTDGSSPTASAPGPGQVYVDGGCGLLIAGWNWSSAAAGLGDMTSIEFDDVSTSYQDPDQVWETQYTVSVGPQQPSGCPQTSGPENGIPSGSWTMTWEGDCGTALQELVYADNATAGTNAQLQVGDVLVTAPYAQPRTYAALEDSYSSGEGNPPYQDGTDVTGDYCHRSDEAYPELLNSKLGFSQFGFYACSGAKTLNVTSVPQYPAEPEQINRPGVTSANLITLTIGGNDAGFAPTVKACILLYLAETASGSTDIGAVLQWLGLAPSPSCADDSNFTQTVMSDTSNVLGPVQATYSALVSNTDPANTSIIAADYPLPFPSDSSDQACANLKAFLTPSDQTFLNQAAGNLDNALQIAAAQAGVNFVDVRPYFAGHEICGASGSSWLNAISLSSSNGCAFSLPLVGCIIPRNPFVASFHPNELGQAGYAQAIEDCINNATVQTSQGLPVDPAPNMAGNCGAGGGGIVSSASVRKMSKERARAATATAGPPIQLTDLTTTPVTSAAAGCAGTLQAGQQVNITSTGFLPGTPVSIYSDSPGQSELEEQLATVTADSTGAINTIITIPSSATGFVQPGASVGSIFLDAIGLGADGVSHAAAIAMQGLALPASGCGTAVSQISPSSGPVAGGTPVTISGSDLSAATEVSFGTTPALSFTIDSPSEVTAVSPPGSGTVDVTVATPQGSSTTSPSDQFSYTLGTASGSGSGSVSACPAPRVTNNHLHGKRLAGKNLHGANLAGYNLQGDDLAGANLRGANLTGADLKGDNLRRANLQNATLTDANLRDAKLQGSNLQRVRGSCATFAGAKMAGDNLRQAAFENTDFLGADLRGASLQNDDLTAADLSNVKVQRANLRRANLTSASLYRARTKGARLGQITWSHTWCPDGTNSDSRGRTCVHDLR